MRLLRAVLAFVCAGTLPAQEPQAAELKIQVLEGAGSVVPRSGRSSKRIVVRVTDASGAPVAGATVSFRLPSEGPTGTFPSGLRSESLLSDRDGKAGVSGIRWGSVSGSASVRVTASEARGRSQITVPVEVSSEAAKGDSAGAIRGAPSSRKWLILAGVAGGAAAGLLFATHSSAGAAAAPTVVNSVTVQPTIGAPSIVVGRP
jgi:hypothetical protein